MNRGTVPDWDGTDRRDVYAYADEEYAPELPPLRPARKPPFLLVWGTNGLTALWAFAVLAALASGPVGAVRAWFPDANGAVRLLLYAAAFVFVAGIIAVLSSVGRRARTWWLRAMAGAALVLLVAGWIPQRRINRAAAAPHPWSSKTIDGVGMGLVTRWDDRSPVYVVGVRCGAGQPDCMADRTVDVALRLPGGHLTATLPPDDFVRLRPGEYRARIHARADDHVRRRDYLAATDWTARTTRERPTLPTDTLP
ncbi:hypothetical protein [Longimicrobium sp.]|uniref:hypothetical protein n=1 Tax=Longimicrobium sp. TaxID=2029185 RepID=UPI002E33FDA0|nr:hypothetical protein [Longimicrobium sp.]HEX6039682.1 hypothetical protein [Longimicrobium sp.]